MMRFLGSWGAFLVAATWLLWLALVHLWPTDWWMRVERVLVFDAPADAPILMQVDRAIHREFRASWSVLVRRYGGGGWEVVCTARGGGDYRLDSLLPDPVTLSWWTDGQCETLPPGRYFVSTIWTIQGGPGLPDKVIQVASNVFSVE